MCVNLHSFGENLTEQAKGIAAHIHLGTRQHLGINAEISWQSPQFSCNSLWGFEVISLGSRSPGQSKLWNWVSVKTTSKGKIYPPSSWQTSAWRGQHWQHFSPLMRPFSWSACRGGLFMISFFSRVFTRFFSVFSRFDDERGTAVGWEGVRERKEEEVSVGCLATGLDRRWAGMVVRMKSGRAGRRRKWDRTDVGMICHGGCVKI